MWYLMGRLRGRIVCLAIECFICKEPIHGDWSNRLYGHIIHKENCGPQLKLFGTSNYKCKFFCPNCNRPLVGQQALVNHYDEQQGYLHHYELQCICNTRSFWDEVLNYEYGNDKLIDRKSVV